MIELGPVSSTASPNVDDHSNTRYSRLIDESERPRTLDQAESYRASAIISNQDTHPRQLDERTGARQRSEATPGTKPTSKDWRRISVPVLIILGSLVTALFLALGHFWLFKSLNNTPVEKRRFKQSQVTAVSILLVTLFKASIIAGIGTCFAQHLWFLLRRPAPISVIEQMFTMRTNLISLVDIRIVWRAPALFFMAILVWSAGIATISPPGALTIELESYNFIQKQNLSVMNPPVPSDFNPFMEDEMTRYPLLSIGARPSKNAESDWDEETNTEIFAYLCGSPIHSLMTVSRSIMYGSPIFEMPVHTGANSSYELTFRAPQVRCKVYEGKWEASLSDYLRYEVVNETMNHDQNPESKPYGPRIPYNIVKGMKISDFSPFQFTKYHPLAIFAMQPINLTESAQNLDSDAYGVIWNVYTLECSPYSVGYRLNISYPGAFQQVHYTQEDWRPLPAEGDPVWNLPYLGTVGIQYSTNERWPWPEALRNTTKYSEESQSFIRNTSAVLPYFNEWAILNSLTDQLKISSSINVVPEESCMQELVLDNGTNAFSCDFVPASKSDGTGWEISDKLRNTVFDLTRFNDSAPSDNEFLRQDVYFHIDENLLNQVLANITISALSLGTWWDMVPVNITQFRSIYKFSHPLNLILPYTIYIILTAVFTVIGLYSLWMNGLEAKDGGFIQVMMATRGDTEMEKLAVKDNCVASDISDELKRLEIRYGKLMIGQEGEDGETRPGFGTVAETESLRKRR